MKSKKFDCFFLARTRISYYLKGIKFNLVFLKNSRNLTHAKNFKNVKYTQFGRLFTKLYLTHDIGKESTRKVITMK